MLHIILLVLKIIGIVLLSLLGLILLTIVCVLFVPVRYRVRVDREAGDGRPPAVVCVKVTWLLHLVNILVRYPADVTVRVRAALFPVFRIPKRERGHGEKPPKPKKQAVREQQPGPEKPPAEPDGESVVRAEARGTVSAEAPEIQAAETAAEAQPMPDDEPYTAFEDGPMTFEEEGEAPGSQETGGIGTFWARIGQAVEKIKGLFQNIRYTIRGICDKIKSVLDNIQYYREVLESEPFRRSFGLCRKELARIFRMLRPDRFEADIVAGMADPSATGEILAVYGMLYPLIGEHVRVAGDFACEGTRIEGRLYLRGKVRAFTLLHAAVRIYFNRDIKALIRLLKKEAA